MNGGTQTADDFETRVLGTLNPEQADAVRHVDGPALVLAGAGSGKTRVLTVRIANLIRTGRARPHEILALTFTNKAAAEMRERVQGMLGEELRGMFVGTFHSFGARILRQHAEEMGWSKSFSILDSDQTLKVVRRLMKERNIDMEEFDPKGIRAVISAAKNALETPADVESRARDKRDQLAATAAVVYRAYQADLVAQNAVDFDDLLVKPVAMLTARETLRDLYQRRFRFIMVDEYQDTNGAQFQLVSLLTGPEQGIMIVGDSDQAIYRFRGADLRNLLNFQQHYPTARLMRLERNYRSTETILAAANAVITNNTQRISKTLRAEGDKGDPIMVVEATSDIAEAQYVVEEVLGRARGARKRYSDFAILYRTNAQSRLLEDAFRHAGVPYLILGGMRFFDRREIMDVMAYLRVVSNPDEREAFERIVNWPKRGIGKTSLQRLADFSRERGISLLQAAAQAEDAPVPAAAAQKLSAFASSIAEIRELASRESVGVVLQRLVEKFELLPALEAERDGGTDRRENVEELVRAALDFNVMDYPDAVIEGLSETDIFVQHVALLSDVDADDPDSDAVRLMTLHSAKGLEFPEVFIVGLEEGLLPHARSAWSPEDREEERRLFYVGITRAERQLTLTHATSRRKGADYTYPLPSSFLDEIPAELVRRDRRAGNWR